MTLLYRTAEWHGLAKLRMHTESSLELLQSLTEEFGLLMRSFQELTASSFITMELPKETAARTRKEAKIAASSSQGSTGQAPAVLQPSGAKGSLVKDNHSQTEKPSAPPTSGKSSGSRL